MLSTISASSQEFEIKLSSYDFGGAAIDSVGEALPDSTLKACQEADAILLGRLLYPDSILSIYIYNRVVGTQALSADPSGLRAK